MPLDPFAGTQSGLQSPALHIEAITPDDTTDLARVTRAINVAQAGTLRVITAAGVTGDVHVAAGVAFPLRVRRVLATGTTALGIVGLS
ncbi:MAG: hypothetical protein VX791_14460 [Pseudomonadota bacterium]|nr:hypothetical protein [Pseudomonadota bacterium]